jgi:deoxyribodipyrimidine photo-lyase
MNTKVDLVDPRDNAAGSTTDDTFSKAIATRSAGLRKLQDFIPRAGRAYQATRNLDHGIGQHANVSNLSPYLRHRLITEEEVLASVLSEHSEKGAFKFIQEVFWRSYWKGALEHRGKLWPEYQQNLSWNLESLRKDTKRWVTYQQAVTGTTDIAPFNEWVKELVTTGYVHNHARMWFASVWIFTFQLPWELGADFFLRNLLDGDAASNTLAWRWVAGLHTKDKTYLATASNIRKCSGERFADSCDFSLGLKRLATTAQPQQENLSPAALQKTPIEWPKPLSCSLEPNTVAGLLLTEDDLCTKLPFQPSAIAALTASSRSPIAPTSELVQQFTRGAIKDTLQRLADKSAAQVVEHALTEEEIVNWAVEQKIQQLLHPYATSGPTQMRLLNLAPKLAARGIQLTPFMRDYDRLVWPHASKGFFQMGKQIPNFLSVMELGQNLSADRTLCGF